MKIRFHVTFRERMAEWLMAAGTFLWGLNAVLDRFTLGVDRHSLDGQFFKPLTELMTQLHWGEYAVSVGAVRLIGLIVNGTRPRGSTAARALGAWLASIFWVGPFIGSLYLPWNSQGRITYGLLLAFEVLSLYFAVTDARAAYRGKGGATVYGAA